MASPERTDQLIVLIKQAGSIRKAERLITQQRGVGPSKSAIDRAIKGAGTNYSVQCMIDDLTKALSK